MARFGPGGTAEKPTPPMSEAEKPMEAKGEKSVEKPLSDIGRERAERAQATVTKGVEAVKGAIGKGMSFLKEKGMALLALDVAAARAGKAAGEFIKKDAATTVEHAKAVGGVVAETGKAIGGAVKEDWEQTKGDVKAVGGAVKGGFEATGRFATAVGKGAVEAGKTAVEAGVIAGAVGVEVGKFAARKVGEGAEAVAGFAAKKVEQAMDHAQQRYEALQGAVSKLESQARSKIAEARDRFNAKVNAYRQDALKEIIVDLVKIGPVSGLGLMGQDSEKRLRASIDKARNTVGVKTNEFVKRYNEWKLDQLQKKLERAQKNIAQSTAMIEALSH